VMSGIARVELERPKGKSFDHQNRISIFLHSSPPVGARVHWRAHEGDS
jgi:hypothetical protein